MNDMRIWCTVLRTNGTYKSVPVKAGKDEFELDENKYNVKSYRIGSFGRVKILRAIYAEGLPDPLEFSIDEEKQKANLKIDSKAIKNLTRRRILSALLDEGELSRLEKIVIIMTICTLAVTAVNLVLNGIIIHKVGII
jgi:hypothetical protein